MKKLILSSLIAYLLMTCGLSIAQVNVNIVNQKTYGGSLHEQLSCGKKCSDQGYIIGGSSDSEISGDKTEANWGLYNDFWILRLQPDLTINWQKTIGGNNNDVLVDIADCSDGGFLLLGLSASPVSGDKTIPGYGDNDYWLVKIDSSGIILWQNVYGGSGAESPSCIIPMYNGRFLIGGGSSSDSSGTKTENSRGLADYWIVCIDSLGNKLWDKTLGGTQNDYVWDMVELEDHSIVLCGISSSPVSGEKSEASYGSTDIWLVRIDTFGNIIWDRTYGGGGMETSVSLCEKDGYIYVSCMSASGISGLKSEPCMGFSDYWVLKLNNEGSILWEKTLGGADGDQPFDIMATSDNLLLISGSSSSNISGDKTEDSYGASDFWLVTIDTAKIVQWQKTLGGSDGEACNDLLEVTPNDYLLMGYSQSGISGVKTENSRGESDYWIIEIGADFGVSEQVPSEFSIFPNPSSRYITIEKSTPYCKDEEVSIYNLQGNLVLKQSFHQSKIVIDISRLSNGFYILTICNGDKIEIKKFIKE